MSEIGLSSLPLQGKRILVTRTQQQAGVLSTRLAALGATPIVFPTIRIVPPTDWQALDAAFARLFASGDEGYSWLIFTSANGVNICCERLSQLGYDLGLLNRVRIATIGPATAAALARYGLTAQLIPTEYIAESVAEALLRDAQQRGESLVGKRILLPRAAEARHVLVQTLQEAGAVVDEIAAYYTLPVAGSDAYGRDILQLLQEQQIDVITFTSSSTVRNFMQWLSSCVEGESDSYKADRDRFFGQSQNSRGGGPLWGLWAAPAVSDELAEPTPPTGGHKGPPPTSTATPAPTRYARPLPGHTSESLHKGLRQFITDNPQLKIACIGPITAQTAREYGLNVHIEAQKFTIDGLVEAIVEHEMLKA